jgi:hypothetical protein
VLVVDHTFLEGVLTSDNSLVVNSSGEWALLFSSLRGLTVVTAGGSAHAKVVFSWGDKCTLDEGGGLINVGLVLLRR